jgi:GNAT superfamily N-acetyltransferase
MRVLIRPRRDGDIAACADLVREVNALDRYPRFLPGDLRSFLALDGAYGAWVADLDGDVAGHIALLPHGPRDVLEIAAGALGRPEDQLAVVARLFVSPRARGKGAGRMLLGAAAAEAAACGLWPVLDVDKDLSQAIALYEGSGWVRAGMVTVRFSGGRSLDEYVYLGPGLTPAAVDSPDSGLSALLAASACSSAWAARRTVRSSSLRPTICSPTGRPDLVRPTGRLAAGWPVRLNGNANGDQSRPFAGSVSPRPVGPSTSRGGGGFAHGGEQFPGVRVRRTADDLLRRTGLHDPSLVHDGNRVTDVPDQADVVRDEQQAEAELGLQTAQEIEDRALDRDAQQRGRIDEEFDPYLLMVAFTAITFWPGMFPRLTQRLTGGMEDERLLEERKRLIRALVRRLGTPVSSQADERLTSADRR